MTSLPIDPYLDAIVGGLKQSCCLIVSAPPGSGKTTRIAPALLEEGQYHGRIVLVQPRRVAARAAAMRIAQQIGCRIGAEVGYHVRFDNQTSPTTRLVTMTPGILLRQLQSDPILSDTDVVVLDEFHERSLEYDLLLGMLRRLQSLRPELRMVPMSATLEIDGLRAYLDRAPVVSAPGQAFPVTVHHTRMGTQGRISDQVAAKVVEAAGKHEGDILVFLPGVGEIESVASALEGRAERDGWEIMKLYGDLAPGEQDRVLLPSEKRKLILATNVAETSLTIDGVRIVIDSGWARVMRVDAGVGLNYLQLEPISKASAHQRMGRAGRTAAGVCYRLWDEATHRSRPDHLEPEILRVDLASAVLQLACWGESDLNQFPWLTPPNVAAVEQATITLERLGALASGRVTELGRRLNQFPVHPRLARLITEGHQRRALSIATLAAAMLSEREVFDRHNRSRGTTIQTQRTAHHDCDVTDRLESLTAYLRHRSQPSDGPSVRPAAARQVAQVASQLHQQAIQVLGASQDTKPASVLPELLLVSFPDRLAKRRGVNDVRGVMVGGRGVRLDTKSGVRSAELFLCIDVDAGSGDALVRQASAVSAESLPLEHLQQRDDRFFHPTQQTIVTRRRTYWFDLAIEETPIATPLDEQTAEMLASAVAQHWSRVLPDGKAFIAWMERVNWLALQMPDAQLPSLTPEGLQFQLRQWCYGLRSLDEVKSLPWQQMLEGVLDNRQRSLLQQEAPEYFTLPSGRKVMLQYEPGKPPILAARIQEFFGLKQTPRIAGGRVPLLLHLLAPNQRCQQITDDLASFWKNTYATVRKELRGRYPKHAWPEDPFSGGGG